MRLQRPSMVAAWLALVALVMGSAPALAVEYRLQVLNVEDDAIKSFLRMGEAADGASGPGLDRLESSVDRGDFPKSVMIWDRHLQSAREANARAWGAVPSRAEVSKGGESKNLWDEVRWEGNPGDRTVWVVAPSGKRPQEVYRVMLRGLGPIRHFVPYTIPGGGPKVSAASFPLGFLSTGMEDGDRWQKHLFPALDVSRGIAALVGVNPDAFSPDQVYLIITQGGEPTTYKAVLGWRRRPSDIESPSTLPKAFRMP